MTITAALLRSILIFSSQVGEQPMRMILTRVVICLGLGGAAVAVPAQTITSNAPPSAKNPVPLSTAADRSWAALLSAKASAESLPDGPVNTLVSRQLSRASRVKTVADQAKTFYVAQPDHPNAGEARNIEIFSLIQVVSDGDNSVASRLNQAVTELRADPRLPPSTRARGVAAHEFSLAVRGLTKRDELMVATEQAARAIVKEFPTEPQGYQGLLAVCQGADAEKSALLARELSGPEVPEAIRANAATLLDRYALVGRSLVEVLGPEGATLLGTTPKKQPMIIYAWAATVPASVDVGRMVQARRFDALGICLDVEIDAAKNVAHSSGIGGQQCFDEKGLAGAIASRLKLSAPGQIILTDSEGTIRDVRGGDDLERKLKVLGFQTPALVRP